ncbi:outer membrane receptor protein involved in Fe transport [Luteibacter sp. Sphag1AF]|uniref:TonB-dependent receptor n=1 Tax=Luteibacter sp. Sphag1AF TaxID=2587031 RepID=UPI00162213B1|nr:TonB-dependent receptor [Luteibacter sp. Sphag1AF]MBB3227933.1 outer membrane receptor protein involved in Fe transport [Luteibacter sp. Sphag1AF]
MAQSTVGSVYGTADAGAQVTIVNQGNGFTRSVTAGNDGKFSISSLQPGDYQISETNKGQTVNRVISIVAGQGFNLNLAAPSGATSGAENLSTVSVTANALPPIDIASMQTNTVLTSAQIKQLPIARNQTAVALLAPGATKGDSAFGNLASFSGASVAENSYYVNGFNVTNFFQSLTYSQVPFEAIDQEEIMEGGYGAEYGNSTGGVISVNTKRGTNEWKGGVDVTWNPYNLQASQPNIYLQNGSLLRNTGSNKNYLVGNNNTGNANDFGTRYNAWIGGPIIKDKLFMFALVGGTKTSDEHYGDVTGGGSYNRTSISDPRYLVKLDWNINESNILEYTGFSDTSKTNQSIYGYGYDDSGKPYRTDYLGNVYDKTGGQTNILKYTNYVTDDFTISAQYGKSVNKRANTATAANGIVETYDGDIFDAANSPGCPGITDNRQPVKAGAQAYPHCGFAGELNTPNGEDRRGAGRIDFEYKLGDHDLKAGWARDHFTSQTGTAYEGGALYTYVSIPESILGHAPGLDPSDSVVEQTVFATGAKIGVTQKSYYLQDDWHITDNFIARIGARNDGFENTNSVGQTYVKQVHSWQPRLGFSWDVHGDSSLKIYGSAGDYSLPLDANVALRGASASLYQQQFFSYTGTNPLTGAPTGLGPLSDAYAAAFPSRTGVVYQNGEAGVVPDPGSVVTQGLKPFKQREFILGAQQQVGDWTLGIKGIYRFILTGVDDSCDFRPIAAYANRTYGLDLDTTSLTPDASNVPGCYIFNPGSGVTLNTPVDASGKIYNIHLSAADVGEPKYKRSYEALQLTAERSFDNVWYTKASYVWSHTRGNSEGGVDSNNGQADTGTTELFDYPEIMAGTNGYLPNDREHTFKLYGAWQITPEWLVGANGIFQTGRPENCYGLNPIDSQVVGGYGSGAYLYCNGMVVQRGSVGRTPNYWNIDLNASYKPQWFKGLTLTANIYNVFNKQKVLSVNEVGEDNNGASLATSTYLTPTSFQQPRYVQISAEYDFSL